MVLGTLTGVASVAASSGGAATGAASAAATIPGFEGGVVYAPQGSVAELRVSLADGGNATLSVSNERGNYSATLTVGDDGDGTATIRLNTYDGTYRAADSDSVTVRSASGGTGPLAVGTYEALVCGGARANCGREAAAAKTVLTVANRNTDGLRTWVAPASADLSNATEIEVARSSGTLTRSDVVARNDTLVLELRASGLEGAIAAQDGANATARFAAFLENGPASLVVHDFPGTEQETAYLDVTDPSAVTFVPDPGNFSYYVVADLRNASVTDGRGGDPANNEGLRDDHRANFTLAAASPLTADGRETAAAEFRIEEPDAALDTPPNSDRVYLAPGPNRTLTGTTTLAPGSSVTVEVRQDDGGFRRTETVRVRNRTDGPAGVFAATVNLSGVREGTDLDVAVRSADGSRLTEPYADVEVVARTTDLNLSRRAVTDGGVRVARATLSHGGYVAIHRGSADGAVVARSGRLAPGESFGGVVRFDAELDRNATLVAVAHADGPGDALGRAYAENGSVVTDSVEFTVEPTAGTTAAGRRNDGTTTERTATTKSHTATTADTGTGVPGFGLGTGLVALLSGLAVARSKAL
ncbi:BGTF surface domain-containing protein [Halorussus sp. AFM4]|uniref:BGTF surface domain-containing protein n=1 Tax=Halorussus sp. AFM4 TaxID=3421651 RepID=UPI003EBEBDB9